MASAPAASKNNWATSGCPSCMACIAKAVYSRRAFASPVIACCKFVSVLLIILLLNRFSKHSLSMLRLSQPTQATHLLKYSSTTSHCHHDQPLHDYKVVTI